MRASSVFAALLACSSLWAQTSGDAASLPDPIRKARAHDYDIVRFAVIGNYGDTNPESVAVSTLLHTLAPEFVITVGGNNLPNGAAKSIDANVGQQYRDFIHPYVGSYGPGASFNDFFPCLGDEDWATPQALPYLNYFDLPHNERYYTFRRGPVQFFALDSAVQEPDGIGRNSLQAAWLENELRASNAPFKIVYLHRSPYSSCEADGSQGILQWPFREWGASIVLSGQDHVYERLEVSGLPYVLIGLGGQPSEPFGVRLGGSALEFRNEAGLLFVEADSSFARFRFLTTGGSGQDYFVLPSGGIDPGVDELLPENDFWKYLDSGTDPGPNWTKLAFNDTAWPMGQAQLGYGEGDETTHVSYGPDPLNRYVTTWFRRPFFLSSAGEFEELQLRMLYDDGAVVHLNGTEVARFRMPEGPIDATTLASGSASGIEETTFYPSRYGEGLRTGWNVLAIEIHQVSRMSNDLSFAAELVGLPPGNVLLPRGSTWRFQDTGLPPNPAWKNPGFNDSQWEVGPAQLGFGENDEATKTTQHVPTTYFRTTFNVAQASSVRWLSCRMLRDDGAILYLNGVLAARFNMPRTTSSYTTFASFNVDEDQEVWTSTTLDPRLLVEGTNTIAVEMHQSWSLSDDLSFDLELVRY